MSSQKSKLGISTGVQHAGSFLNINPKAVDVGRAGSTVASESISLTTGLSKPEAIAKYLLTLAETEDEPDPLTHLRLQKLMYYVQGWSLALRKRPAFAGR